MNAKLLLVLIALTFAHPIFAQSGVTKRVAILETVDKEDIVSYGVKLMVRSKLAYVITNMPGYEGYDRVDVGSILGEHEFQRTGLVSDKDIKRLGEMTGADYILVAEVAQLDYSHVIIVAKILNVETAQLDKTSNIQTATDVESMDEACRELAARLFGIQRGKTGAQNNRISKDDLIKQYNDGVTAMANKDYIRAASSLDNFLASVMISEEQTLSKEIAYAKKYIPLAYLNEGLRLVTQQNNYTKATEYLNIAVQKAERYGDTETQVKANRILGKVQQLLN